MILANSILPAPMVSYFLTGFLPAATIGVIVIEYLVFRYFQRQAITRLKTIAIVIWLNIISWVGGMILMAILPDGILYVLNEDGSGYSTSGPNWDLMARLSFPIQCILSMILEFAGAFLTCRAIPFRRIEICIIMANLLSYAWIELLMLIYEWMGW